MNSRPNKLNQAAQATGTSYRYRQAGTRIVAAVCILFLGACNNQAQVKPTGTAPIPATAASPLPAPTNVPTATATPYSPVERGTPFPPSAAVITKDNIGQVGELVRWGRGVINDAAFSPDGKTIAVASTVGVFLYKADRLELTMGIQTDTSVRAIAFSPAGDSFAASLADTSIRVWSLDGKLLHTIERTSDGYWLSMAYSPDGGLLASATEAGNINIWKVSDWSLIHTWPPEAGIYSLVFSADGRELFVGTKSGTTMIAVADGKPEKLYKGRSIQHLAVSGDGKVLAVFEGPDLQNPTNEVDIWQVDSGHRIATIKGSEIEHIALSADGRHIAAASWGIFTARVWDASSGALQRTFGDLNPKNGYYYGSGFITAFSPDGRSLLLAGADVIGIWDVNSGALLRSGKLQSQGIESIELSTDGRVLAAVEGYHIRLWQVPGGQPIAAQAQEIESLSDVDNVALAPDGSSLAVVLSDGTVRVYPMTAQGLSRNFVPQAPERIYTDEAFSSDGQVLALTAGYRGAIELRNAADGSLIRIMTSDPSLSYGSLKFSPDGQVLAAATDDSIRLYRTSNGKELQVLNEASVYAFSPDGTLIAGGGYAGSMASVWEAATGRVIHQLQVGDSPVNITRLAFSPDGKLLAVGALHGTLSVWDVPTGDQLRFWKAHTDDVTGLVFTPDGKTLISSSMDGTIRLWGIKQDNGSTVP